MFVRYFDLGVFKGGELSRMNQMLSEHPLVSDYELYGFEAHPRLARHCRLKFMFNKKVHIVNTALGDSEGQCTLYLNRNLVGSSIYQGKNNVIKGREITVPKQRFTEWLKQSGLDKDHAVVNIIKSNIEGAEWEVWHDLMEQKLTGLFDLWFASKEGYDGWAVDLLKIDGMEEKAALLEDSFRQQDIYVHRFSSFDKNIPNSDVKGILDQKLKEKSGQSSQSESSTKAPADVV